MWEPVMCVGISYFLLAGGKEYFDRPIGMIQSLSKESYSAYIIHPVVLVGMTFLAELLPIAPYLRFIFVLLVGIQVCFVTAAVYRVGMKGLRVSI